MNQSYSQLKEEVNIVWSDMSVRIIAGDVWEFACFIIMKKNY